MLKKLIYVIAILFLSITTVLNLVWTANLDSGEHITIRNNGIIYTLGVIALSLAIFFITKKINEKANDDSENEKKKKIRKKALIITIVVYALINIAWCLLVMPPIVGDQIHACNLAQTFYNNNLEEFLPYITYAGIPLRDYMEAYHQQISLAFVFSLFFRLIHFDGIGVLRVLNIIGNVFIVIALYKIGKHLSKKYKTNIVLLLTLIVTFISEIMLTTFIYGDTPSLAFCLFAIYFMMKYRENGEIKYPIIASIFTMFAFMMRMNSLIFIIATVIYLILDLFDGIINRNAKENLIKCGIILMYLIISIIPSFLIKNYYLDKYNMDKTKAYPNISYFLIAMEESERGNGWYSEQIGEPALKDPKTKSIEYKEKVKERLKYFSENIGYAFDFYTKKLTSMWTENTYSAIWNNREEDKMLENFIEPLTFYQKALIILMCRNKLNSFIAE